MNEQEELKEKVKNMSPEELRKFQKEQCIFCHIIKGDVQSRKVYEDEVCIAILDINPANPGHLLLLPKEHYAIMPQITDEIPMPKNIITIIIDRPHRSLIQPAGSAPKPINSAPKVQSFINSS